MLIYFSQQCLISRDRVGTVLQKSQFCFLGAVAVKSPAKPFTVPTGEPPGLLSLLWGQGNKCASSFTRNTWKYLEIAIGKKVIDTVVK